MKNIHTAQARVSIACIFKKNANETQQKVNENNKKANLLPQEQEKLNYELFDTLNLKLKKLKELSIPEAVVSTIEDK